MKKSIDIHTPIKNAELELEQLHIQYAEITAALVAKGAELTELKNIRRVQEIKLLKPSNELAFYLDSKKSDYHTTCNYFSTKELKCSGTYNKITEQYILEISVDNQTDLNKLGKYIIEVAPFIESKSFNINESTCCEFGVFTVEFTDTEYSLCETTYGKKRIMHTYDDVMELLEYIEMYHNNNYD